MRGSMIQALGVAMLILTSLPRSATALPAGPAAALAIESRNAALFAEPVRMSYRTSSATVSAGACAAAGLIATAPCGTVPGFRAGCAEEAAAFLGGSLPAQTLKRKSSTSPSFTTYSLPSTRIFPASFAPCSPPRAT